ncbi:MAG: DUF4440 domain-containing protein [Frankiaceae bacterium]|nr:DUF4440 domain-containing protein [Arenimonas sp.]
MQKNRLMMMAAVLALLAGPVLASDGTADSADDCWLPAFKAMDADAAAQCYLPDAVLWLPGAPMMQGRDAIHKGYVGFFSAFTIKSMDLVETGRSRHGDDVTGWGSFKLVTVSKADGKEVTEVGRFTVVSRKVGGKWMYVVDHASDDPVALPTP